MPCADSLQPIDLKYRLHPVLPIFLSMHRGDKAVLIKPFKPRKKLAHNTYGHGRPQWLEFHYVEAL
jgi:hypothetical protein